MSMIFAYYFPSDFNERDEEANKLMAPYTTERIGSGTFLGGERDIQWRLKDGCAEIATATLERAGFRAEVKEPIPRAPGDLIFPELRP